MDQRELRARLEAAQGEVKRLSRALAREHRPDQVKLDAAERLAGQLTHRLREVERFWQERERDWQQRERALRDALDQANALLTERTPKLARAERKVQVLEKQPLRIPTWKERASRLGHTMASELASVEHARELEAARREIARLNELLSGRRPGRR